MPGGDGTGPMGQGAMTGRAAGFCAGYPAAGYANPVGGRGFFGGGFGRGRGLGRGRRNWFYATGQPGWARAGFTGYNNPNIPTQDSEKQSLQQQAQYLKSNLEEINRRLEQLEKESDE